MNFCLAPAFASGLRLVAIGLSTLTVAASCASDAPSDKTDVLSDGSDGSSATSTSAAPTTGSAHTTNSTAITSTSPDTDASQSNTTVSGSDNSTSGPISTATEGSDQPPTTDSSVTTAATGGDTNTATSTTESRTSSGTSENTSTSDTTVVDPNAPAQAITYPTLPGAVESELYTVTVNGTPLFVEHMTKFAPEMQVHYAHSSLTAGMPAAVSVAVNESFNAYRLSPTSRQLDVTRQDNTLTFATGPNYLILALDDKELLFLLFDEAEIDAPKLGDADVKDITDYDVDATGATLETAKIQAAIDAASGADQNILYFPPGKYLVGELWLKSDMTLYLEGGAVLYGSDDPADFNTGTGGCRHRELRAWHDPHLRRRQRRHYGSRGHRQQRQIHPRARRTPNSTCSRSSRAPTSRSMASWCAIRVSGTR